MSDAQATTLANGGRWYGSYGLAFCPVHDNTRTPALTLGDGEDGRLLVHCKAGCKGRDVLAALRDLGHLEGDGRVRAPDPWAEAERAAAERAASEKKASQASALRTEASPAAGSIAETYLRGRGISCDLPSSLRFHPTAWHPSGRRLPALVALVEGADTFAVHRTYLRHDGSGKAPVDPPRAMLGRCAGGAVRLSEGHGRLVVAEGIETALSLMSGLLDGPASVWAALSTSGMKALRLPRQPARLMVAVDNDDGGGGYAAALALAERADLGGAWTCSSRRRRMT